MKKIILLIILISSIALNSNAQDNNKSNYSTEKYGNTLNLGLGLGYYGYLRSTLPVLSLNYEIDVAKNFTLAPFIGLYSHRNNYYWGAPGKPKSDPSYRNYSYRETAIPLGVKGTYYLDNLLTANSKWDFYIAGSLGFVYRSVSWESGYYGDRYAYSRTSPLYLDGHLGAEYHINNKAGLFLDLSTGVSTVGLSIKL